MDTSTGGRIVRPLVAVLNTTEDVIALVCSVLEDEGYATVGAYIADFREGRRDLVTFFDTYKPDVVLFDLAIPYDVNWRFFQEQMLGGGFLPEERYVLMTTNLSGLKKFVDTIEAVEVIGKPFDLEQLVQAVRRAGTV
ncbi:hypothetical protein SD80_011775 [Scytonema tolypothrichoides VB-61278]|nr:hypothetical protein SD80_011775 [Scytonema tolypothrichoides VB-61278]